MNYLSSFRLLSGITACYLLSSCSHERATPDFNGYPDDIGRIVYTSCATTGCHTDQNKEAAAGLSMMSWNKLFEGGRAGAVVIPYRSDYSTMHYYVNTFSDLGVSLNPTMPYNKAPLTREEVQKLKNWIDAGAPSKNNLVKFSDNALRKKYYVTNQGCDVVSVIDQQTLLTMRFIDVGSWPSAESPHKVNVSPDGQYWYVLSLTGQYLEKYRTSDDAFVAKATIGSGFWNDFIISGDSQKAYCTDLSPTNAKVAVVDLVNMTSVTETGFNYPHGIAINKTNDTLYITQQINQSKLYKVPVNDFSAYSEINLFTTPPAITLNPHEVIFSPDGTKYAVSCQGTSEVRIFQTGNDQLLAIIPVGSSPTEMSFSETTNYLFVSCTEDITTFPEKRGSVAVINYQTNSFVLSVYTGHQPHGIAVDDSKKMVVVVNRNIDTDGPTPHHQGTCAGRNGYVSFINMNTFEMIKSGTSVKKVEIAVDPYSVSIRK